MKRNIIFFAFVFSSFLSLYSEQSLENIKFNIFNLSEKFEVRALNDKKIIGSNNVYKKEVNDNIIDKTLSNRELIRGKITVYFPKEKDSYPLVLITHGWMRSKFSFLSTGRYLASQGYIVAVFSSKKKSFPEHWLPAFKEVCQIMHKKNKDKTHPLYNLIDTNQLGIIAHSMGGTAALAFANTNPTIKAIIAIHPYNGSSKFVENIGTKNEKLGDEFINTKAATLIFTGEADKTAYAEKTYAFFENLNKDVPACFLSFQDVNHNDGLDALQNIFSGGYIPVIFNLYANLSTIWLNSFLKNKKENMTYLKKGSKEFNFIEKKLYKIKLREHKEYPNYASRNLN